jgi:hypothetical protein
LWQYEHDVACETWKDFIVCGFAPAARVIAHSSYSDPMTRLTAL